MDFRVLSQEEYDRKIREVIVGTEGHHARVQDVGDDLATIGWGYTLNNHDNVATWRRAGIELTPEQLTVLERVDRAPGARKTEIGLPSTRYLAPQSRIACSGLPSMSTRRLQLLLACRFPMSASQSSR